MSDPLFCDDCGGIDHVWEDCPLTRDFVYDEDTDHLIGLDDDLMTGQECNICEKDIGICDCAQRLVEKYGIDEALRLLSDEHDV